MKEYLVHEKDQVENISSLKFANRNKTNTNASLFVIINMWVKINQGAAHFCLSSNFTDPQEGKEWLKCDYCLQTSKY